MNYLQISKEFRALVKLISKDLIRSRRSVAEVKNLASISIESCSDLHLKKQPIGLKAVVQGIEPDSCLTKKPLLYCFWEKEYSCNKFDHEESFDGIIETDDLHKISVANILSQEEPLPKHIALVWVEEDEGVLENLEITIMTDLHKVKDVIHYYANHPELCEVEKRHD